MKRRIVLILAALLLACLAAGAGAETPEEAMMGRLAGEWCSDEYRLIIRPEEDGLVGRLTETDGDCVWDLHGSLYVEEEACLYFMNYERYRQVIDWDSMELVQEDWSLGDLAYIGLTLPGDGDALVVSDVPYIDEPLTLRRADDGE